MSLRQCSEVTVADIVELRAGGLTTDEVWSLMYQAVQSLQDLFLSDEMCHEDVVPAVTPFTLSISSKGRVDVAVLTQLDAEHRGFLAPEYADWTEGRVGDKPTQLDWEKMWVFSLGRTLSVSLSTAARMRPSSLVQVLSAMTQQDPVARASLMFLLNVMAQHCSTTLPTKPFSHLVVDMYREVLGSPPQCLPLSDECDGCAPAVVPPPAPRPPSTSSPPSSGNTCSRQSSISTTSGPTHVRRNPVQRAPSRLYRGPTEPLESTASPYMAPRTCVGPEFVVRAAEPARVVHVGDVKAAARRTVIVTLLTGARVEVTCDPSSMTVGHVFHVVVQLEKLQDNYTLGLACLSGGDFVFLPPDVKLHKVAPPGWKDGPSKTTRPNLCLYMRVKFFLPSLRGVRHWTTKHLLYLQLRRSLLEQQVRCEVKETLALGGLALQAEFGNYEETSHGGEDYFLLEHYVPEDLLDAQQHLKQQLVALHRQRRGLDPGKAEEMFIAQVQRLEEYGCHHYTGRWVRKDTGPIPMWVSVSPQGVFLYEKKKTVLERKIHEAFPWKHIQRLSYNKIAFNIVPHDVAGQKATKYKIAMDNNKSLYLFRLASFHHQFFLRLRVELSSLHSLAEEFGVPVKTDPVPAPRPALEERQNKENEQPWKKEKRGGVRMGVRAVREHPDPPRRRRSVSETSNSSSDAYVIESSVKSFGCDLDETIPTSLANRFNEMSWEDERILRRVELTKDRYGSLGLEIIGGPSGGVFVQNVLRKELDAVQRGDQLLSVNGICLLNLGYQEALQLLKNTGERLQVLVSQSCRSELRQKPIETEYLRNIRYDMALEEEGQQLDLDLDLQLQLPYNTMR